MKILAGVFNPIGFDGRVHRSTVALASNANVRLVCPSGGPGIGPHSFDLHTVDLPAGTGSRFLEHPVFWWALIREAQRFRPDIVYVHDHYLALAGKVASRLVNARLVYDAHELAIPEPGVSMIWQDRAKYLFDRIGVRSADLIITTGEERAAAMQEHYGLTDRPLVIRNIAVKADGETEDSFEELLPGTLDVDKVECLYVYAGHVTLERGIQYYLEAMQYLPDDHHLLVVGGGPHVEALQELRDSLGLVNRIHFTGRVPRHAVVWLIRQCDVGLLSYSWTGLNNLYCSPNKVFEYALAGVPMVATAQPALRRLFETADIGLLVEKEARVPHVAEIMQAVFDQRESFMASLPAFLEEHDWEDEAERLRKAVGSLFPLSRGGERDGS